MRLFPILRAPLRIGVLVLGLLIWACSSGDPGIGGTGGAGASGGAGGVGGGGGGDGLGDPSALDAIDAALEAGDLTDIDALRYKVFAVFGDERLPAAYRASGIFEGTQVVEELGEQWSTLPANVQTELEPFMLPPAADGSWFELQEQQAAQQAQKSGSVALKAPAFSSVSAVLNRVRIRYPAGLTELATQAGWVKEALENDGVWDGLIDLMGREPVSDGGLDASYNGGDDRFDIYIVRLPNITSDPSLRRCYGWATPYAQPYFVDITDDNTRGAYVVINADVAQTEDEVKATTAHEFFHVLGHAFDTPSSEALSWLHEATATWAIDYIYPSLNIEHRTVNDLLKRPQLTLSSLFSTREYGTWMYWYFLTKRFEDDSIVRRVWELSETMPVLDAVDAVTPGGFEDTFQEFAATLWNRPGFSDNPPYNIYQEDGLVELTSPSGRLSAVEVTHETPMPNPEDDIAFVLDGGGVARLSAQYVHYDLSAANVRTVLFANGYNFELAEGVPNALQSSGTHTLYATELAAEDRVGRKVVALIKQDGNWEPEPLDLSDVAFMPFCNLVDSESAEELVLIFINAEHRDDKPFFAAPRGLPPRLLTSNMGCGKWSGSGSAQEVILNGNDTQFTNVEITNIEFTRPKMTLNGIAAGGGEIRFGDELLPPGTLPALNWYLGDDYELANLEANWQYDEDTEFGGTVCAGSGSGTFTEADVASTDFQMGSHLRAWSGAPSISPLYRSFYTELVLYTGENAISGTCTSNGQPSPYTTDLIVGILGGYRDAEFGMLRVDPSGDRINVSWSFNDLDATLDLRSGPIP